jgi:thiol-disulfide isomerase/thioredoxin
MKVDRGKVRPPEIGRYWINSHPLAFHQLRGRVVLVDFWDYTCVNCVRTLPYVQEWWQRYRDKGLVVIGIHTPEFTFARYESNVERGVKEFGLTYPIVVDSDYELWKAFANRYWPTKYLIDKDGYLVYAHFGEGHYDETEATIQQLLQEIDPKIELPPLMAPVREEDKPGAVCYQPTAELYLGYRRGRIGNEGGFKEDLVTHYHFDGDLEEGPFYAKGTWASTAEYLGSEGEDCRVLLKYSAAGVNLVMAAKPESAADIEILQDGNPLGEELKKTTDTVFREGRSFVHVDKARMYRLVDNHDFTTHALELRFQPGIAAFAFTFTSCLEAWDSKGQAREVRS